MPQSTQRDLHIDKPLTNVLMAYRPEGMIADQIAPIVPVGKQSDSYYIFDIAERFSVVDDFRAPADKPRILTRSISTGTFYCKNRALRDFVPIEDIKNADAPQILVARQARGEGILDQLALNWEYRVAKQVTSGSNVGSYTTVASAWNDKTSGNSDPIGDIQTAIDNIRGVTGMNANSIVLGYQTWNSLKRHADIIDAQFGSGIAPGQSRVPTIEGLKKLFALERVLVGRAVYNSAAENQTATLTSLWDDQCLVYYAPMTPRADKPSFMYSMRWNAIPSFNMTAKVGYNEGREAEEVKVGYYQDEKITGSTLGFLVTGCNSSQ